MVSAKTICGSKPDMNVFEHTSCATRPVTTRNARLMLTPINTAAEIKRIEKSQISFHNIRFVSLEVSEMSAVLTCVASITWIIKTADWLEESACRTPATLPVMLSCPISAASIAFEFGLWAELDAARATGLEAVQAAEAGKIEQKLAFGKERDKSETLVRELASARKEAEARSALLAAAH